MSRVTSGHPSGRLLRGEEPADLLGGERPGEDEALAAVAALLLQPLELLALLDPFGQRLEVQRLAEAHERVDELTGRTRLGDRLDERLVDLQRVDREPAEVRERRVAGAEVVDGDAHTDLLER